jgi:hypothetical protein
MALLHQNPGHPLAEKLFMHNSMEQSQLFDTDPLPLPHVHRSCPRLHLGRDIVFLALFKLKGFNAFFGGPSSCSKAIWHDSDSALIRVSGQMCAQEGCRNMHKVDTSGSRPSECSGHPFRKCRKHYMLHRHRPRQEWGGWEMNTWVCKKTGKPGEWYGWFSGGVALYEVGGQVHPPGTSAARSNSGADPADAARLLEECVPIHSLGMARLAHHCCTLSTAATM